MESKRRPLRETLPNPRRGGRRKTKKEFVADAIHIHGNKYDYSKVRYKNSHITVLITCPKHGDYRQLPHLHLMGGECPGCNMDNPSVEEFYSLVSSIDNGMIDTTNCKYDPQKGKHQKAELYCTIHKEYFSRDVRSVLDGKGCTYCAHKRPTREEFIEIIKRNHGDNIDATDCNYTVQLKQNDKVNLFCNIHGKTFSVEISRALKGRGCPYCERTKGRMQSVQKKKEKNSVLYSSFRDPLTCSQIKFYIYEPIDEDQIKVLESAILDFQTIQKYDLIIHKQSLAGKTISGDFVSYNIEEQQNSRNQMTIAKVPFSSQFYYQSDITFLVSIGNKTVSLYVEYYGSVDCWDNFLGDINAYGQLLDWRLVKTQCSVVEIINNKVA